MTGIRLHVLVKNKNEENYEYFSTFNNDEFSMEIEDYQEIKIDFLVIGDSPESFMVIGNLT